MKTKTAVNSKPTKTSYAVSLSNRFTGFMVKLKIEENIAILQSE